MRDPEKPIDTRYADGDANQCTMRDEPSVEGKCSEESVGVVGCRLFPVK